MQALHDAGVIVRAHHPQAMHQARKVMPDVGYWSDPEAMLAGADVAVLVTECTVFRTIGLDRMALVIRGPVLVDLRNPFSASAAEMARLHYFAISRASAQVPGYA